MLPISALLYSRRVPQMAALALISFGFAGCSADMSSRLSQNPFSNPFGYQGDATGAVQPAAPAEPARQSPQYSRPQVSYPAISAPQAVPPAALGREGSPLAPPYTGSCPGPPVQVPRTAGQPGRLRLSRKTRRGTSL